MMNSNTARAHEPPAENAEEAPGYRRQIEYRRCGDLKPHERNPRTHSKKQIRQIADSIRTFGWTNPVLVDAENRIIAGHGRVDAARLLGIDEVPTIRIEHLTEAQKRAYIIADNKLAEKAGWDRELLTLELKYVQELDVTFDLTLTGFETTELDQLFADIGEASEDPADEVPEVDRTRAAVSRPGDLWQLGRHRLLCADSTKAESYAELMAGDKAQMVFTDPPYNVRIDGNVCGLGSVKHREFAMASGEMSEAEFTAFLESVFKQLADNSLDGSIHFICMDWRHLAETLTAGKKTFTELKNLIVWNKNNGGMGTFYRSKHELILAYKNGTAPHLNSFELGQTGRYRTNVWDYAGVNTMRAGRMDELVMHPTVKPVALVADAMKDCSKRGGLILDAFAGSGTTIIAAERTARRATAIELDPHYVDVAIRRWQAFTGKDAVLNNNTFEEMAAERAGEMANER